MNNASIIKNVDHILFIILFVLLAILEIFAAELSYENFSWLVPILITVCIFLNLLPLVLYLLKKRILAIVLLLFIGCSIVPYQYKLAYEHLKLKEEAANIVNYCYRMKLSTGKFPETIDGYSFVHKELKDKIDYTKYKDKEDFEVWYYVGTRNTDHFYIHSNSSGKWCYYDD